MLQRLLLALEQVKAGDKFKKKSKISGPQRLLFNLSEKIN